MLIIDKLSLAGNALPDGCGGAPPIGPAIASSIGGLASKVAGCRNADAPINYLQDALICRHWGWSIIPVSGKGPALAEWTSRQTRRPTDRRLGQDFGSRNVTGLGVILGRISDFLCCRDFDVVQSYLAWAAAYPHLAALLPTVQTYRGFQVYCRMFGEVWRVFEDGELRGTSKGYAVLPPSWHPEGIRYEWVGNYPAGPSSFPRLNLADTGFDIDFSRRTVSCAPGAVVTSVALVRRPQSDQKPEQDSANTEQKKAKNKKTSCVTRTAVRTSDDYGGAAAGRSATDADPTEVWEAVARCLPDGPGERHRRLFDLARSLKALAHLTDADSEALEGIVRRWHQQALAHIRTKCWATTWRDFRDAWMRVRFPMGSGPLDEAMRVALAAPMPPAVGGYTDEPTRRLLAVCAKLQEFAGDGPFFLACRSAKKLCGFTNHMTAARRLGKFVAEGILKLVKPGSGGTRFRRAADYRYLGLEIVKLRPDGR